MKPLVIQQVVELPYLDIGKLICMSQNHGDSGDTLDDEQVRHKSIQYLSILPHVVFSIRRNSPNSHVLSPKINISTPVLNMLII